MPISTRSFSTSLEARENGCFSKHHETPEAHDEAARVYESGMEEKYATADYGASKASTRTPIEQLRRLDKRLGTGIGAAKERRKLFFQAIDNRPLTSFSSGDTETLKVTADAILGDSNSGKYTLAA